MLAAILYGPPASGKSTMARKFVDRFLFEEINRDNIRFSVIQPGGNWKTYKFSKKNEKEVTRLWWEKIRSCAFEGKHIVISDTLCNEHKRMQVVEELKGLGYKVACYRMKTPLKVCIERDEARGDFSVGEEVIRMKWKELYGELNE